MFVKIKFFFNVVPVGFTFYLNMISTKKNADFNWLSIDFNLVRKLQLKINAYYVLSKRRKEQPHFATKNKINKQTNQI